MPADPADRETRSLPSKDAQFDRWLFYFEGHATGGDSAGSKEVVDYLESGSLEIERNIVREIRQALPLDCKVEVDIRFAPGSLVWYGMASVTAVGGALGAASANAGMVLMFERLVSYAIDRVVQEQAAHYGYYDCRTRPRGAPHVRSTRNVEVDPIRPSLAAIDARLEGLERSLRVGLVVVVALIVASLVAIAIAFGFGWRSPFGSAAASASGVFAGGRPPLEFVHGYEVDAGAVHLRRLG